MTEAITREQVRHWMRVAAAASPGLGEVALMHDVVEDGVATIDEVRGWLGPATASVVATLTRMPGEGYGDYINRIVEREGSTGRVARIIKLADIRDNLDRMDDAHEHNREKYERAIQVLTGEAGR